MRIIRHPIRSDGWSSDLNSTNNLGYLISMSLKIQRKYLSIKLKIVLFSSTLASFDQGLRMYFSGTMVPCQLDSLTTRTKREICTCCERRAQRGTPMSAMKPQCSSWIFKQFNVKSYKAITAAKGERMILGYFEKLADVELTLKMPFTLQNQEFHWSRSTPLSTVRRNRPLDVIAKAQPQRWCCEEQVRSDRKPRRPLPIIIVELMKL
jgi:hypothetical protein